MAGMIGHLVQRVLAPALGVQPDVRNPFEAPELAPVADIDRVGGAVEVASASPLQPMAARPFGSPRAPRVASVAPPAPPLAAEAPAHTVLSPRPTPAALTVREAARAAPRRRAPRAIDALQAAIDAVAPNAGTAELTQPAATELPGLDAESLEAGAPSEREPIRAPAPREQSHGAARLPSPLPAAARPERSGLQPLAAELRAAHVRTAAEPNARAQVMRDSPASSPERTIEISIGRVEIRAEGSAPRPSRRSPQRPSLDLASYLEHRSSPKR